MNTPTIPAQLADAQTQIAALSAERDSLKATLATAQDQLAIANTSLEAAKASIVTLTSEKEALTVSLSAKTAEIATLSTERDTLKAEAKTTGEAATVMMAQVGQTPPIKDLPKTDAKTASTKPLSGFERVMAAFRSGKN